MILPPEATPLLLAISPAFTRPTFARLTLLIVSAVLTPGRRTVANLLRTIGPLADGDAASYNRVLCAARYSTLQLACLFTRFLLARFPNGQPIPLVGDDTVDGHRGKCVHGKARHRDPVRSSHSYTAFRYGHKWVVLAVLVPFPWSTRPWALPICVSLYYSAQDNEKRKRLHRTPAQIMCRMLRMVMMWCPDRSFVFAGDAGYGSHEVARFCRRHRSRLTLVSKFVPDANLFEPPPPYSGRGRPRVKGEAMPKPADVVAASPPARLSVGWYGGGTREVGVVSGIGQWYKSGHGPVPVMWVFVRDLTGTHRDEYFFTTGVGWSATAVISAYTGRWNIETTFQELRSYLGLETTKGWCKATVLRAAPMLLGLYSVVALWFEGVPECERVRGVEWEGKEGFSFSDAIHSVRRRLWRYGVLPQAGLDEGLQNLPEPVWQLLLAALAPAE